MLLCISETALMAIAVSDRAADRVSIEGNDAKRIEDENAVRDFCECVKNYYSINSFAGITFDIKIVDLGAPKEKVQELFDAVRDADSVNLIALHSILPVLLLKARPVKAGAAYTVRCFHTEFYVTVDEKLVVGYADSRAEGSIDVEIAPEELACLFRFDCNGLIADEEERRQLKENYQETVREKDRAYQKLQEEKRKLENKLEKLQKKEQELQKAVQDAAEEKAAKRVILRAKIPEIDDDVDIWGSMKKFSENGDLVSKGKCIAQIECYVKLKSSEKDITRSFILGINASAMRNSGAMRKEVKSTAAGRIFYLVEEDEEIRDKQAIAVIADPSDTYEEVMKWYRETVK